MSRQLDERTFSALLKHLKQVNFRSRVTSYQIIRSLFRTAWEKEGWGARKVAGQDLLVAPDEVRAAQRALKQLGYEPGPVDGVFGPATFSGVELFQEDNELNVTGLRPFSALAGCWPFTVCVSAGKNIQVSVLPTWLQLLRSCSINCH